MTLPRPKRDLERRAFLAGVVALLAGGSVRADELTSGPQVGSTIPGRFEVLVLTGPDAGDESCLFCKYGNARVVMMFARQPSAELSELVRAVEKAAPGVDGLDVGICLVVTDPSTEMKRRLGKFADGANLKHVVLAVVDPAKVTDYALSPDAGVTVLLYSNKVVRSNHAFKPGGLTAKAREAVVAAVKSHLGTK
ncbi:MAG: hypothetical protein JWO38_5786 [Gemmataceae bacterium]|nr:hypothetical protein [Gemmataceae bacterium]